MKKLLPLLAILLFFVPSFADHIAGGDIEYKLVGTKTWKIRLTLYRDCTGIPLCSGGCGSACTVSMTARPASATAIAPFANAGCTPASFNVPVSLNLVSVTDAEQQATALCPSSRKNNCNNMGCTTPGLYSPSVEKYVFEGTLNLNNPLFPAGCSYWEIFWESCCRNVYISTIQNPSGTGYRIGTVININEGTTLANNRNNSPVLGNEPFIVICGGQEYFYNMGATDPDGDSLSYALAPSIDQGGAPVTYIAPFTFTNPLPYNPLRPTTTSPTGGFTCDTFNGDINFVPVAGGTYPIVGIMTVQIKQWRRNATGQPLLVGITQRDLQVWIVSCPNNNIPKFLTSPGGPSNKPVTKWNISQGDSLCFDIIAKDTDYLPPAITDTTKIFIDTNALKLMPGATFTPNYTGGRSNGPREDSYRFCWKPQSIHAREVPYFFSVTAYDSRCPNPGRIAQSFAITVLPQESLTPISKTLAGCNRYNLSTAKTGSPSNGVITWKISTKADQNNLDSNYVIRTGATLSSFAFNGKGKFVISAYLQYPNNDMRSVMYDTIVVDSFITTNKPADVGSCGSGPITTTLKISSPDNGVKYKWFIGQTPVSTTDSLLRTYTSTTVLTIQSAWGSCTKTDTVGVYPNAKPVSTLPDTVRPCYSSLVGVDVNTPPTSYLWSNGSTERVLRLPSGKHTVTMTNQFGCTLTDTVQVLRYDSVYADAGSDTIVCIGTNLTFNNNGVGKATWYQGSAAIGTNGVNVKIMANSFYRVKVEPANSTGSTLCAVTDSVSVSTKGSIPSNLKDTTRICHNSSVVLGLSNPSPQTSYLWNTGDTTSNITANSNGIYSVTYTHAPTGCVNTEQTRLIVYPAINAFAGNDTILCKGSQLKLKGEGNGSHLWSILNGSTVGADSPTVSPAFTTTYIQKVTQQAIAGLCIQYDTIKVTVASLPTNNLQDSVRICGGSRIFLGAVPVAGQKYLWNTGDTTSTYNATSAGTYKLTVTNVQGCAVTDSTIVRQNPPMNVWAGNDVSTCPAAVTLTSNYNSGNQWYILPSTSVMSTQKTYSLNPTMNLTQIMLRVTQTVNGLSCSSTDTVNINLNQRPQLGTRPAITEACAGNTVQIPTYPVVSGGTGKWVYAFNPNAIDANNNTVNTSLLKTQPSGTGTATNWIIFSYTSDSGCTATDSVAIKTYGRPAINRIVSKRFFCETDQPVTAASVFNYTPAGGTWSGNGFTTTNNADYFHPQGFTAYPAASIGTYNYIYTYANTSFTCDVSDTVNAYVLANPVMGTLSGNLTPNENSTETYTISNPSSAMHQWYFSGESQVINTSNTQAEVKWGSAGNGLVKVTATNASQCVNSDSLTINIQQAVGIREPAVFRDLKVFPNPAQAVINIEVPAKSNTAMRVELYDITGKMIMDKTIDATNGKYDATLNVSHLSNGTYFISIGIGSQQVQRKINIIR